MMLSLPHQIVERKPKSALRVLTPVMSKSAQKYGFIVSIWKYLCNYKENRTVFKPASHSIVSLKVSRLFQVALLGRIHSAVA